MSAITCISEEATLLGDSQDKFAKKMPNQTHDSTALSGT